MKQFSYGIRVSLLTVALYAPGCTKQDTPAHGAAYEVVTNAVNGEDWKALRELAKDGMRANEYIGKWEQEPVRIGKSPLVKTDYKLNGQPCTKYSFELQFKNGRPNPHLFEVVVQEDNGVPNILDFWEFGW